MDSIDPTRLDVDGAIQASALGILASGLVLSAMLVMVLAFGVLMIRSLQLFGASRTPSALTHVPWPFVIIGASVTAIVGGILGSIAAISNANIVAGVTVAVLVAGPGLWPLGAIIVGFVGIRLAGLGESQPWARVGNPMVAVVAIVIAIGVVTADRLPRPDRFAEAQVTLSDSVQGAVVLSPAAAGSNDLIIGLTGPDDDVNEIRDVVQTGTAIVSLVSLAGDSESTLAELKVNQDGALTATGLRAADSGRWRIEIDFGDSNTSVDVDVTLQPNPRATT